MRKANWAIEKVTGDMRGRFAFNTAIAAVMELVNEIYRHPDADARGAPVRDRHRRLAGVPVRAASGLGGLRAADRPAACGSSRGRTPTPTCSWPRPSSWCCMVNGKVRDRVTASTGAAREELEALALASGAVRRPTSTDTRSPR